MVFAPGDVPEKKLFVCFGKKNEKMKGKPKDSMTVHLET
jgi:hypothetical protein